MGISGSDVAYRQARSGIEICDASRTGFYTFNIAVRINGVSRVARKEDVSITRHLGQPSRATLSVRGGTAPVEGQEILIGLGGTAAGRLFGGTIMEVNQVAASAGFTPVYELQCIDWTHLFNRRRVTEFFTGLSATGIAREIIDRYTSGFSHLAIAEGLPVINAFPSTAEEPSRLFDRLANLIDGVWYIDPHRTVHLFTLTAGEPKWGVNPGTLNDTNRQYEDLTYRVDLNLVRTRVFVEGQGTRTVAPVTAGSTSIPVENARVLDNTQATPRVMIPEVGILAFTALFIHDANFVPFTSAVNAAAAVGVTSIQIDSATNFPSLSPEFSWARIGSDLYIRYTTSDFGIPGTLSGIPASGLGSITRAVAVDEVITMVSTIYGVSGLTTDLEAGRDIYNVTMRQDATKQTALAALEGGDGIHEFYIQDRRLNITTQRALADAELVAFGQGIESAEWLTTDPNVGIGKRQAIATTQRSNISASLIIDRIVTSWDERFQTLPKQQVHAATTFPKGLLEAVIPPEGA